MPSQGAGVVTAVVVLAAFVLMEPVAALLHRYVMHGRRGWTWHASHHRSRGHGLERNDLFPVVFAATTVTVMVIGASFAALHPLLAVGSGITLYGGAYLAVHDGYVHARFGLLPGGSLRYFRSVRAAHAVHHATGAGPYGFLLPVRRSMPLPFAPTSTVHPP
jgi:beta-carotene 3-hydroxylase